MPQKWEEQWPLEDEASIDRKAQRNEILHRIGNLTILTGPLNLSVSNAGWSEKREKFGTESVLKLNKAISSEPTWDEKVISMRSLELAQIFCKIWPRPGDGV